MVSIAFSFFEFGFDGNLLLPQDRTRLLPGAVPHFQRPAFNLRFGSSDLPFSRPGGNLPAGAALPDSGVRTADRLSEGRLSEV